MVSLSNVCIYFFSLAIPHEMPVIALKQTFKMKLKLHFAVRK